MAEINRTKEVLEFIWDKFEFFLRRTILPSVTFFALMLFICLNHDDHLISKELLADIKSQSWFILTFLFFIVVLSTNYILKILAQIFFDNFIKVNYDTKFFMYKEENESFVNFRKKVLVKLVKDEEIDFDTKALSDFELYQVLGRILGYYKKDTDVKRYATDTKEAGVTIMSIFIALLWYMFIAKNWGWFFLIFIFYYIGFQYIKSKYRSRAYRMYANYLVGDKPIKEIPEV